MINSKSYEQLVLEHVYQHGSIDTIEAWLKYRIADLDSVLADLKNQGYCFGETKFDDDFLQFYLIGVS